MFAGTACTPESILQSAFDGFREARRVVAMLLQLLGPVEDARSEQLQALLRISSQNMVAVKVGEPACCEFCAFMIKLPPALVIQTPAPSSCFEEGHLASLLCQARKVVQCIVCMLFMCLLMLTITAVHACESK